MFHEKLKAIRIKCEKTQKDLADYLNISPQSISKWEKGEALPSLEYLPKIAKFYNCDINLFFEEQNTANIEALLKELKELEERLEGLECEEPDEDDEEAHEEWEQEVERVEEEIEEIKEKLEIGNDGKWCVASADWPKSPKQRDCSIEKYKEFFLQDIPLSRASAMAQSKEIEKIENLLDLGVPLRRIDEILKTSGKYDLLSCDLFDEFVWYKTKIPNSLTTV